MWKILVLISALIASTQAILPIPTGIVEGITDCGSSGRLGRVELTDCTLVPCHLKPFTLVDVAVRFTASLTSQNLALHFYRAGDDTPLFELSINGVIQAGIEYELKFQLRILDQFAGTAFDSHLKVLDLQSQLNEICVQIPVIFDELGNI